MDLSLLHWVPEMQLSQRPVQDAYPSPRCPTKLALFSAESLTLVQGLEWCLKTYHFQSALALLSTAPVFLQPKSFWDIWDLSDSLSSHVALSFHWVPSHAGLPGKELADSLAKTRATLPFTHVPSPLASVIAKIRHTRYSSWRRNLSHNSLFCQIPSVSSEEPVLTSLHIYNL